MWSKYLLSQCDCGRGCFNVLRADSDDITDDDCDNYLASSPLSSPPLPTIILSY
jgi:hypothetical protein